MERVALNLEVPFSK